MPLPCPAALVRQGEVTDLRARVLSLLAEAPASLEAEALAKRLAALGPGALPVFLGLLAEDGVPGGPATGLTSLQRAAIRLASTHLPHGEVIGCLRAVAAGPGTGERAEALLVLGEIAGSKDLQLFLELANTVEEPAEEGLSRALGEGLSGLLRREPSCAWSVVARLQEFAPWHQAVVLAALGGAPTPELPRILADQLGRREELDPLLLVALRKACKEWRLSVDERVLACVRAYLGVQEIVLLTEAVALAGEMDDTESVLQLIALLEHADAYVRESACRALRRISGKSLAPQADAWLEWRRDEIRLWLRESDAWLASLRRGEPAEVVAAMRQLAERPLFRSQFTEALTRVLERREAELVGVACAVLAHLRAYEAVPELSLCLDHPSPRVRSAAGAALLQLVGRLPEPLDDD